MRHVSIGTFHATPLIRGCIERVLDTGRLSYGPFSETLERRFAEMHGCKFGVLSNSGTSSLQVALQALKELRGWKDGDEVLIPATTFVATVNIVLHNNLMPVLVDVDSRDYGIDPALLRQAWTPDTRAIIPVHLYGQPCQMPMIEEFARDHGLALIEDSCETMLVPCAGKTVGSWGDVGCFSFYMAHLLTAGVGGIGTTNDPELAAKMRSLVNHGRDGIYVSIDDDDDLSGGELREIISRRFNFETIGHSYRITEFEAAVALAQLDDLGTIIAKRQKNAAALTAVLASLEDLGLLQLPTVGDDADHAFMMYPIVVTAERVESKWPLCNWLEERGIETREMMRLTDQPAYLKMGLWKPDDYPVAKWINERGLYVGCHQGLDKDDMDYVGEQAWSWFVEEGLI